MARPMTTPREAMPETVESWAIAFVTSTDLSHKRRPPAIPDSFDAAAAPLRIGAPGRPAELEVVAKSKRSLRPGELRDPAKRARLLHTFWHHELQAAELLAWAVLAFPDTPEEFRRGLLRICGDELRHMRMYEARLVEMGHGVGDFPVRDWFWQRVPSCETPLQFVALLGLGLEGANLDHADRYADGFEAVGDQKGAAVQRAVGADEVAHVRFAAEWFAKLGGGVLDFDVWAAELVPPLSPTMFRGRPLNRADRRRAGLSEEFLDALEAFEATP
jgi:uncharacterized ferritin-like protein (DUF455 family)